MGPTEMGRRRVRLSGSGAPRVHEEDGGPAEGPGRHPAAGPAGEAGEAEGKGGRGPGGGGEGWTHMPLGRGKGNGSNPGIGRVQRGSEANRDATAGP